MAAKRIAKQVKTPPSYKPTDYLRGSQAVGQKYTAWDNFNQGRPDFGKGAGPGTPYHEVTKKVPNTPLQWPSGPSTPPSGTRPPKPRWVSQVGVQSRPPSRIANEARINVIRRRLGWT